MICVPVTDDDDDEICSKCFLSLSLSFRPLSLVMISSFYQVSGSHYSYILLTNFKRVNQPNLMLPSIVLIQPRANLHESISQPNCIARQLFSQKFVIQNELAATSFVRLLLARIK